jgi:FkbM family methyltransferase
VRSAKARVGAQVLRWSDNPIGRRVGSKVATLHGLFQNDSGDHAVNGERWLLQQVATDRPAVYLDVGANAGKWAAGALAAAPAAQVHAFEPSPATFAVLARRFGDEPRVHLSQVALGAQADASLEMWLDSSTGSARSSAVAPVHDTDPSVEVAATSGDAYLAQHSIARVDFLKVDVEGYELQVLGGFAESLAAGAIDVVQFEFTEWAAIARVWLADLVELLDEHGYRTGKLFPKSVKWRRYRPSDEIFYRCNLVAVRPGTDAAHRLGLDE